VCFSLIQLVQSCLIRISEEAYEASNVCIYIERGIHRARSCGVAACRLAKLLRHHRHLCCVADWIDVRGDHLDRRGSGARVEAFGSPTVVHFGIALLVAAILSAPWQVLWNAGLLLDLCGLGGVTYFVIVVRRVRRARHQADYQPVLEDWLWYTVFPLVSYTALLVAAIVLPGNPAPALFVIGAGTVLLLFTGIHNAWDTVTYLAIERSQPENKSQD